MAKFELSQETRKNLLVLPQVRNKDGNFISHEESNPDPRTGNSIVSWAIACFIYDTRPIPTARITKMLNFKVVNFHYPYYLNYSNLLIHESLLYTSSGIFREIIAESHCKSSKRKEKIFFSFKGLRKIRSVWTDTGGYNDDPSETRIRTVEFHGSLSGLGPWRMECKFKSTHYLVWKNLTPSIHRFDGGVKKKTHEC